MPEEVTFWTVEGSIYPKLDAMGIRGETTFTCNDFNLGANQKLAISVSSKTESPVGLRQQFNTSDIDFKMYFRSGNSNWFGVDNQSNHGVLHMHFVSGDQTWDDRIELPENITVSQLISDVFVKAEDICRRKFPSFVIRSGSDFLGVM
jgi:hypothetical protein